MRTAAIVRVNSQLAAAMASSVIVAGCGSCSAGNEARVEPEFCAMMTTAPARASAAMPAKSQVESARARGIRASGTPALAAGPESVAVTAAPDLRLGT